MSYEDDDDGWDDYEETVSAIRKVNIDIRSDDIISKEEMNGLIASVDKGISMKMERLNLIMRNLNVYGFEGAFLVNDEFGVCKDFKEVAEGFGMKVTEVSCGLKGRSYVVSDSLIDAMRVMNPSYTVNGLSLLNPDGQISETIKKYAVHDTYDKQTESIMRTFASGKAITIDGTQEYSYTTDGFNSWDYQYGDVKSAGRDRIVSIASKYIDTLAGHASKVNSQMQAGTVSILNSRAKKMGYSVRQKKEGDKVQLVLVRYTE